MRPDSLDPVFKALANPVRRRILDLVHVDAGCNVNDVCGHFAVTRTAVLGHLNVLEEAGLLLSEREWRERKLYFNAMPIQAIYDRWTSKYSALWAEGLAQLKYAVETEEAS